MAKRNTVIIISIASVVIVIIVILVIFFIIHSSKEDKKSVDERNKKESEQTTDSKPVIKDQEESTDKNFPLEDGKVYYLKNKWRCDSNESRCDQWLSFKGNNVELEDKVPWKLIKVDEKSDQFYLQSALPVRTVLSFDGKNVNLIQLSNTINIVPWIFIPVTGQKNQFYLQNKWRCDQGESRCNSWISFDGSNVVIIDEDDIANKIPWELVLP